MDSTGTPFFPLAPIAVKPTSAFQRVSDDHSVRPPPQLLGREEEGPLPGFFIDYVFGRATWRKKKKKKKKKKVFVKN